uniref:Uncharacterized protein n=1 Tax=Ditylum brightwellii TaxID=49249 RepID=A0A7S1VXK2_9STRA|mmetsp:Transcript_11311/g.16852  ORF Transcript_11311/g.16852 Transcript_11311/m.16852 type:complete len:582 (+) Transcript_11311:81-1826(+)
MFTLCIMPLSFAKPDASQFGHDEIYIGTKRVHLAQVPGETLKYEHEHWKPSTEKRDIARALSRAVPGCNGRLGACNTDVVIPAIPAVDIVCSSCSNPTQDVSSWPLLLQKPLLKVKEEQYNEAKAFASGVRSAVVKVGENRWFRLKGCGNNDDGFIIRHTKEGIDAKGEPVAPYRDIRGSAFEETAIRELYMSSCVDNVLNPQGVSSCNKSMGYYRYDEPNLPLGPHVTPCCIVEETLGDRRLGTHIMSGIEILLPLLVKEEEIKEEDLLSIFPEKRPGRNSADMLVDTCELMTDYMIAKCSEPPLEGFGMPAEFGGYPDLPRDHTLFGALGSTILPEIAPDECVIPQQWTREGPREADSRWNKVWKENCENLSKCLSKLKEDAPNRKPAILTYLFSRIGYDCGKFMRSLHAMKTSWGTYQDAMCREGQWHCNAHANNMVLIPEEKGTHSFLSYLDLDMAFTADTFLDVWGIDSSSGKVGISEKIFDNVLFKEHVNFMEVLVGADSTNGVPQIAKKYIHSKEGKHLKLLKVCLYDTLLQGYMQAYFDDDTRYSVCSYDADLHEAAYNIIRLAVIIMSDYVA